jgi:hypothetical protein
MNGSQAPQSPDPLPRRVPGSSRLVPGKRPEIPPPWPSNGPAVEPRVHPAERHAVEPREQAVKSGIQRADGPAVAAPGEDTPGPEVPSPDDLIRRAREDRVPRPDDPVTGPVVPGPGTQLERQAAGSVASRPATEVAPSWPRVLGTTVRLWAVRRRTWWRVISAIVVVLVVFAAGGLTVVLLRNNGSGTAARGGSAPSGTPGLAQVQAAAAARQQAAAWVTAQVSHSAVVSCDPAMCAALQARGFPAGDLMTLGSAASDPLGSAVIVATTAVRSEFGSRLTSVYAPTVMASFGSGSARIDVRVYAAGGAAAYLTALRADQAVRQRLGSVLLRNSRVSETPAARAQLAAGQVDTRLLAIIATLSAGGPVSIAAFGDAGPGASAGVPLRAVELASPPGAKDGYLRSVLALLSVQQAPYLPNSATIARLADGRQVVRIEFAAPSPLGLLSG